MGATATKGAAMVAVPGLDEARRIWRAARIRYAPRSRIPVVRWTETVRMLSAGASAFPGPHRLGRTPWWREVLEWLADDETEEGVVAKSSQVGYTEMLNSFIGWCMAEDPSSLLMIQPTITLAESWSKERLEPMLRDTPALKGILRSSTRGMARSSDDTILRKAFAGGWLAMVGANSPSGLASRPVRRVLADERDRFPVSAGAEGDPYELGRKRTITYWNRKLVSGGTPTEEGASPTWAQWERSDQRHWVMPCPHCGFEQPFKWRDGPDGQSGSYHLVFDRDAAGEILPESVGYRCGECAALIDERQKGAMVAAGRWRATYPGRRLRGYHIWAAYSPFMSWVELLREFDAAKGAEALLRVFVNTILGLPFAPTAEKLEPTALHARAEPLDEALPGVGLLTAGVDVQADRLEYVVCGWGDREACTVLAYGQVNGDPGDHATWDALTAALAVAHGGARALRVRAVAVDTGYRPETGFRWVQSGRLPFRAYPTVGRAGRGKLLITPPGAVTKKQQRRPWVVGTDTAKDSLAARLRSAVPGPQSVQFADTLPVEYYEHLTAEELRTVYVANRPVRQWVLRAGRRNEGLDCTLLALAALHALGPAVVAQLGALVAQRSAPRRADADAPRAEASDVTPLPLTRPAPLRFPRPGGGWTNGWKK